MARGKFWIDIAASNNRAHEVYADAVAGGSIRTFRVYLLAFQDKNTPPSLSKRFGGVVLADGKFEKSFDGECEPFSVHPGDTIGSGIVWDSGQKMILVSMFDARWKWITGSNLPRQSNFFATLDGFTTDEINTHGLAVSYTSANPMGVEISGFSESLDKRKGEEAVTFSVQKRYQQ